MLRWIWAYLFDCVHSHTTWPHRNQLGLAYVCCLDCGREMPYSLEFMQILEQDHKRNIWPSRSPVTAPLIIAGAMLLLTPSYAIAQTAAHSDVFSSRARVTGRMHRTLDCQIFSFPPRDSFHSVPGSQ